LIDDEVKMVALGLIGVMVIATVYPILASNRAIEPFSELGILGQNGRMGDYPSTVTVGRSFNLFLHVGNHEGRAEYYRVLAKVGDQGSNVTNTTPLNVLPFASWDMVLLNNQNRTLPITLSLSNAGVNKKLVFELHMLDTDSGLFVYHQRWTQIWLNITTT
jgi:uncharacterized membrane protein